MKTIRLSWNNGNMPKITALVELSDECGLDMSDSDCIISGFGMCGEFLTESHGLISLPKPDDVEVV